MAGTKKVTVTLPVATLDAVRRIVGAGHASSVSGFAQHAVGVALDEVAGWSAALSEALASTGGELSMQERWADVVLGHGQRRPCMTAGVKLDVGALIGLDRGDRRFVALLARAEETSARVALDRTDATSVGRLLAASGTADIVDAHVVVCARRTGQAVATADPDDLRALDPSLTLVAL